METRNVTIKEALMIAANNLGNIQVPIALHDQISSPVAEARKIILMCAEHITDEKEEDPLEEEIPEDEPELHNGNSYGE